MSFEKKSNGLRKHIVGMLVNDEPGVLAKISGMFTRRGFNIDTIIVGKTNIPDVSHIVISLLGNDRTIEQLDKQLYKMIDIVKLADFSESNAVVREHCLLKVSSTEKSVEHLNNVCKLFEARVLHVNTESVIVELASSPSKIDSLIETLAPFGIKELSRTGVNALQKD
ncbi:MAG: acetolactate synthase small subunit [Candidatus Diapherotrites archaeon]|nr:acetolactate synthase small subunit [Candidatus Diapherotrites archaeon]